MTGASGGAVMRQLGGALVYLRTMGVFVLVWWIGAQFVPNRILLPSPLDVAVALRESARDGELLTNASVSLGRLILGVTAAALLSARHRYGA